MRLEAHPVIAVFYMLFEFAQLALFVVCGPYRPAHAARPSPKNCPHPPCALRLLPRCSESPLGGTLTTSMQVDPVWGWDINWTGPAWRWVRRMQLQNPIAALGYSFWVGCMYAVGVAAIAMIAAGALPSCRQSPGNHVSVPPCAPAAAAGAEPALRGAQVGTQREGRRRTR